MEVKYCGPRDEIEVAPYGPHRKDAVEEYPDDFARELLATSKKQRFEAVGKWEEPEQELEPERSEKIVPIKKAKKKKGKK